MNRTEPVPKCICKRITSCDRTLYLSLQSHAISNLLYRHIRYCNLFRIWIYFSKSTNWKYYLSINRKVYPLAASDTINAVHRIIFILRFDRENILLGRDQTMVECEMFLFFGGEIVTSGWYVTITWFHLIYYPFRLWTYNLLLSSWMCTTKRSARENARI